ncbi:Formin Homology 14 [Prunus dulcis]|uniref:Formin-like protein n=1 Tax=Prunus dulcis TaxID=3755 RepID=A0A4Y1RFQ8_PRUDU|nr:Formin Homology 14 [Prunus dulcis]
MSGHHPHLHLLQDREGQPRHSTTSTNAPSAPPPPSSHGATPPPPPHGAKGSNAPPPRHQPLEGAELLLGRQVLETVVALVLLMPRRKIPSASDGNGSRGGGRRGSTITKPEKVQLVDLRRAYNCEIMLSKVKIPLPDMINAVLALDSSVLDIDQVENLIKFCPSKEEMETLKNYTGDKEMLGKCEQFFVELMKVPRVESKLRVFAFKITFSSQVNDLRLHLNTINGAAREVKESAKLRQIMQTILTLGNALNQGTARGSAIGFKLDSLLKLSDTRARNNKMTLMHYLCKLIAEKMPELLDFNKDLVHLEAASKIQLKALAEEMQAVSKGLEKVEQELAASENDGAISAGFQKGRNADSLSQYFGEDPARCPFEQVTQVLFVFVKMFNKSREENERLADVEKRKLEKEAMKERTVTNSSARKDGVK